MTKNINALLHNINGNVGALTYLIQINIKVSIKSYQKLSNIKNNIKFVILLFVTFTKTKTISIFALISNATNTSVSSMF